MKKRLLAGLAGLLFLLGMVGMASASLVDGLVAYYPLNGNALDASGNGNNGVVYGATPTVDRFGNTNGAYSFDGVTDYIDIGNDSIFNIHNQITISMWLNADSLGDTIISKWKTESGWQGSWGMRLNSDGGANFNVTGDGYSGGFGAISADKIEPGSFHHIAGVYNTFDNTIRIFVDGIQSGTGSGQSGSIFVSNSRIYIGATDYYITSGHRYSYFDGTIDDVRIYNRALSGNEIMELAAVPIPGTVWLLGSGLLALFGSKRKLKK